MSETMLDDQASSATGNRRTNITVTATASPVAPGVAFSMVADFPNGGGKQGKGADKNNLEFDKGAGEFDLVFTLDDSSGKHLAFYPEFDKAFWAQVGTTCPPPGPMPSNGSLRDGKVTAKNRKLTLLNLNEPGTITFMLRFTGDSNGSNCPPYQYDPKIINGGDGPPIEGPEADCD